MRSGSVAPAGSVRPTLLRQDLVLLVPLSSSRNNDDDLPTHPLPVADAVGNRIGLLDWVGHPLLSFRRTAVPASEAAIRAGENVSQAIIAFSFSGCTRMDNCRFRSSTPHGGELDRKSTRLNSS